MNSLDNFQHTEEQLRQYEYIISTSMDHMSLVDSSYIYQVVNDAYLKAHNKKREEIIGHSVTDLLGKAVFNQTVKDKLDACLAGEVINYSKWFEFSSIGRRYMNVCYYPYKPDNDTGITGVVVISRDTTEHKLAIDENRHITKALYKSQESLKKAQQIARLGSWEWDIVTDTVSFSDEYYHLFGFELSEKATREDCLARIHPDDIGAVIASVEDALQGKKDYFVEYRIILPDDQQKYICGLGEVVRDSNRDPLCFYGTVHDITEVKLAENRLKQSRDELEQRVQQRTKELQQTNEQLIESNNAKSQFLTRMSHELRTPLNSIIGFAQLLEVDKNPELTSKQMHGVKHILKGGWHLLEVVNDLLDLAAIEANKVELNIEPVNLAKCIQDSLDIMLPLAKKRNISLNDKTSLCKDATVKADFIRLKQVLLNLLSNAVKYNHDGGSVTISYEQTGINTARISITDTGSGINKEDMPILFEPFNRLYMHTHAQEGTGIGLTISKQLIERMNGSIGVVSEPGYGSTFWIELQLCGAPGQTSSRTTIDAEPTASVHSEAVLLYIEDSPSHIQLMEGLVESMQGIRLFSAHTPLLGLELIQAHKPDIIVLDICLPGMDGFEILEKLLAHKSTCEIPVIAVSANALNTDIEKGLRAGFRRYLTKPLNIVEFRKCVTELLHDIDK